MRKFLSILAISLVFIIGCMCLVGCDECSDNPTKPPADEITFVLNEDENGYIVTGRKTTYYELVDIPATHKNLPVVGIAENAFSNSNAVRVIIPTSVKTIGKGAFSGCNKLVSVNFKLPNTWSAGNTSLRDEDLMDKQIAAEYLKSTYADVEWVRDKEPSASMGDLPPSFFQ